MSCMELEAGSLAVAVAVAVNFEAEDQWRSRDLRCDGNVEIYFRAAFAIA